MRCPVCGKGMKKTKGSYKYVESGLDNVILENIPIYRCACGESMPELKNIEELHTIISDNLVKKAVLLTGQEIRFIRKQMGLNAKELASVLSVSPVTVSRWETGTEKPGLISDKLIRMLYIQAMQEKCHKVFAISDILKTIKTRNGHKPLIIDVMSAGYHSCFTPA